MDWKSDGGRKGPSFSLSFPLGSRSEVCCLWNRNGAGGRPLEKSEGTLTTESFPLQKLSKMKLLLGESTWRLGLS